MKAFSVKLKKAASEIFSDPQDIVSLVVVEGSKSVYLYENGSCEQSFDTGAWAHYAEQGNNFYYLARRLC